MKKLMKELWILWTVLRLEQSLNIYEGFHIIFKLLSFILFVKFSLFSINFLSIHQNYIVVNKMWSCKFFKNVEFCNICKILYWKVRAFNSKSILKDSRGSGPRRSGLYPAVAYFFNFTCVRVCLSFLLFFDIIKWQENYWFIHLHFMDGKVVEGFKYSWLWWLLVLI